MKKEKRYDVVIKDMKGKVVSVSGRNLTQNAADLREMTTFSRINTNEYFVAIVPAKKAK